MIKCRYDYNEIDIDYLNPTNNPLIKSYLLEIKKLEKELSEYLDNPFNLDSNVIAWYESCINLKWDNLKFYKKHMIK